MRISGIEHSSVILFMVRSPCEIRGHLLFYGLAENNMCFKLIVKLILFRYTLSFIFNIHTIDYNINEECGFPNFFITLLVPRIPSYGIYYLCIKASLYSHHGAISSLTSVIDFQPKTLQIN